jgi:DNA-binding IclR family transcriptional regulator
MPEDATLQCVHRTITALRTISTFRGQWFGITAMSEKMQLPKSTTHRLLQALVVEKILDYEEVTNKYRAMVKQGKETHA